MNNNFWIGIKGGLSDQHDQPDQPDQFVPTPDTPSEITLPKQKPFGALDMANGLPYYGSGFQGWVRKAWSDLSDPAKYFQDQNKISLQQQTEIKTKFEAEKTKLGAVLENATNWSSWGEKFFGISTEDIATFSAAGQAEKDIARAAGDSVVGTQLARTVRIAVDTTQNLVWGGLAVLGLTDQAMRKMQATRVGLDAVADKFNPDTDNTFVKKLFSDNIFSVGKDTLTIASAISQGRISWDETGKTLSNYRKGSEMAYSMMFDEYARAEFEKGLQAGRDPGLLAQELGNPLTELAGSVLGDPMTYFGMTLIKPINIFSKEGRAAGMALEFFGREVKLFGVAQRVPWQLIGKLPDFGEIIGVGSKAIIGGEKLRFIENSVPGLEDVMKGIEKAAGEPQAKEIMQRAVNLLIKDAENSSVTLDAMRQQKEFKGLRYLNPFNLATLDNEGKINVLTKDAGLFFDGILRTNQDRVDTTLQVLRDMITLRKGDVVSKEQAAARLLSNGASHMITSDVGRMTGEILSRIEINDIGKLVEKIKNPADLHEQLFMKLEAAVKDAIPSVDEMLAAADEAKAAGKAGLRVTERTAQLAKWSEDLPDVVKAVNRITRFPEKVTKKTTAAMVQMFMNLVPRPFARNIEGQALMLGAHFDMQFAISSSIRALSGLNPLGLKTTDWEEKWLTESIIKNIGALPRDFGGIGEAKEVIGALKKTKIGFLPSMGRAEHITSLMIIEKSSREELMKALPTLMMDVNGRVMPEWQVVMDILPKNQQSLLSSALKRTRGNFDEATKLFREWAGTDSIEAWRLAEPSAEMSRHLDDMHMLDSFYDIQRTAKTDGEFTAKIDELTKTYAKEVRKQAAKLVPMTDSVPSELNKFASDIANHAPGESNDLSELIQAWQNTRSAMDEVVNKTAYSMHDMVIRQFPQVEPQFKELFNSLTPIKKKVEPFYEVANHVRDSVWELIRDKNTNYLEAWNTPIRFGGKDVFSLADIYPNVDLKGGVTKEMYQKYVFPAMAEWGGNNWRDLNVDTYNKALEILDQMAGLFGSSLDEVASARKDLNNPYLTLTKAHQEATNLEEVLAVRRFNRQFKTQGIDGKDILLKDVTGKFADLFPEWKGEKSHIFNAVNSDLETKIPYEQITLKQALTAIRGHVPPHVQSQLASSARILHEGLPEFMKDVNKYKQSVVSEWGMKVKTVVADGLDEKLRALKKVYNPKLAVVQNNARITAVATRNFLLHDYNRTYADHALTYLFGNSMHYWTTRTYMRGVETLVNKPQIANQYMRLKQYMAKNNADMPEWYRYNVQIGALPGVDMTNPYYVNLEAAINPVYGMTGVDFNDPYKRVDWVSRMIDDGNKMGPSFSPLVSWAVALHLYNKGEEGAAQRWMGRLFPQSPFIKSATAAAAPAVNDIMGKFGIKGTMKPVEVDPFVNFLDGGIDPYERNRVAAAFAEMVNSGQITQEEAIDASRLKTGKTWDAAVQLSADKRFVGDASSFFLGAGARPRTQNDLMIEKFWGEYGALVSASSLTPPDEYRAAWDTMRTKYPFMDALLIGRKTGEAGDTAFSYNVFGRIPPGQLNDISEFVGLKPYMIEQFYNAKGDFDAMGLNPQDKARFMSAVTDLALMLKIPEGATREEWNAAKKTYAEMNVLLSQKYGTDIQDRISQFYDLKESEQQDYLDAHPDVNQALQDTTAYIANTPILSAYYGGIQTVERYYSNSVYRELEKTFGYDIQNIVNQYYDILDPQEAKRFKNEHNLTAYFELKSKLEEQANRLIIQSGSAIPKGTSYQIRPDFMPNSGIQQEMFGKTQQTAPKFEDFQQMMTPVLMQDVVLPYLQNGQEIPYSAKSKLDYVANQNGYSNMDDLLRAIGISMQQAQPDNFWSQFVP